MATLWCGNVFLHDFFRFSSRVRVRACALVPLLGVCVCARATWATGPFSTWELVMLPSSGCPSGLQPTLWEISCARGVTQEWLSGMPPSTGLRGHAQSYKKCRSRSLCPPPLTSTTKETLFVGAAKKKKKDLTGC